MLAILKNFLHNEIDPAFAKRAEFIFQEIENSQPERVLDAGCGRGFYSYSLQFFPNVKEIYGFDVNIEYVRKAKQQCKNSKHHIREASIYKLPYKSNSFDFVILSEVLEHLSDEDAALQELHRVLKKGGQLAVTVPNFDFPFFWDPINWLLMKVFNTHISKDIWWLAGIWADHLRLYRAIEIETLLKRNGFRIKRKKKIIQKAWPFTHLILYGIGKNIVERFGNKQFNRFNFDRKPFAEFVARIVKFPSKNENEISGSSVCLLYLIEKK